MAGMKMLYYSLGVQTTSQTMEEDILKFQLSCIVGNQFQVTSHLDRSPFTTVPDLCLRKLVIYRLDPFKVDLWIYVTETRKEIEIIFLFLR